MFFFSTEKGGTYAKHLSRLRKNAEKFAFFNITFAEKCAFFNKGDKRFAQVPPFSVQKKYLYIFKLGFI